MIVISSTINSPTTLIEQPVEPTPLLKLGHQLAARKWLIILLIITATATTYGIKKTQAVYETSATVTLSASAAETFIQPVAFEQILKSDNTLEKVKSLARVNLSTAELREMIRAENVSATTLIIIHVADTQSARAKRIADVLANQFVAQTKASDTSFLAIQANIDALNQQLELLKTVAGNPKKSYRKLASDIDAADREIAEVKAELARAKDFDNGSTSGATYIFLLNQRLVDLNKQKHDLTGEKLNIIAQQQTLLGQKQALVLELQKVKSTRVLGSAARPTESKTPDMVRSVFLAGLAALFAGTALALAIKPQDNQDLID